MSVLWSAPLLFAVHFVNERRATLVARQCAQKTIQSLEDEAHLKVFLDGLNIPSWVYVSDTHKMGWFNQTVARLWPFISRALTVKADKQNEKLRQSKRDFDDAEGPVDGSEETDEDEGADTDSADEEDVDFSDFDLQISEINKRFNSGADGADLADVSSRCSTPSIEDGLTEPEPNDEDGKTDKTPTETEKSEEVGKKKKKKWRKSRLSSLFVRKKDRARKDGRKGYQFVGGHAGIDVDGKGMDIDSSISRMDMSNIIQLIVKMREKIESIRLRKKTSTEKRGREERKKNKKNEKRKTAKDSAKKDTQTEKTDTKHQKKKKVVVIQHIADFDIGDVPPMITGFKVYPTRDDEDQPLDLTVDVSFSWVSNMRVTVKMAVKGLPMSVALSNVQLVGESIMMSSVSATCQMQLFMWRDSSALCMLAVSMYFMSTPTASSVMNNAHCRIPGHIRLITNL